MRTLPLAIVLLLSGSLQAQTPKVNDERLKIELFAEAPDIVTPIGIDVDDKGRVYVVESHTHFPPDNYKLEKTDRIRVFEDTNGDRKADKITNFHTGETHTMGIALYRDGSLYVATRKEVFRLRDKDGDGKADERTSLIKLDTKGNYPHNGLSGFAFDFKGDVYFGFGENLGESYKLIGSDGTTLTGGGEGGNIYVCDPEGKKLRRVATGFWNPFHLCFDTFGRLFAVDNDPDGRPPCRLLHIVEGGDYGYRFRYGRGGQHPFTSWNGEIPGTLPMIAGTGEAPSGVLTYESDNLPDDYLGTLLVTSWGDHRIEKYRLKSNGASFTSKMEPVITGGENFRPVGIALAPDGSLFISDWVDKSYNVHGKGRVWRISAKEEKKAERPDPVKEPEKAILSKHRPTREKAAFELQLKADKGRPILTKALTDARNSRAQATAISALNTIESLNWEQRGKFWRESIAEVRDMVCLLRGKSIQNQIDEDPEPTPHGGVGIIHRMEAGHYLFSMLMHEDPFARHAAVRRLLELMPGEKDLRWNDADIDTPGPAMIGMVLITRSFGEEKDPRLIKDALAHPDADVRFLAIQWIAEEKLTKYRKDLTDSLARPNLTPRLLVATLTALDMLDGSKPGAVDQLGARWYLERLLFGDKTPAATKAMAMRMLPANNPALTVDAFKKLLASEDEKLRVEVVRTLRDSPHKEKTAMLRDILVNDKLPMALRLEAAVAGFEIPRTNVKEETLRWMKLRGELKDDLNGEIVRAISGFSEQNEAMRILQHLEQPQNDVVTAWIKWLEAAQPDKADIAAGERHFFNLKAGGCYRCHTVSGRGGEAGPDLSTIGKSLTREKLLESILQPSKEIAPRFAAQLVELSASGGDGEKLTLMYVGPAPDGTQIWADTNGKQRRIAPGEIESKRALETSIMPTGLHNQLTARELRDLLAFLENLK